MESVKIGSWSRCETCDKYKETKKEFKVGDKVNFPSVTHTSRCTKVSVRTGKLFMIGEEHVSVIYRKKMSRCNSDQLSDPSGTSPLTVAMLGQCKCKE